MIVANAPWRWMLDALKRDLHSPEAPRCPSASEKGVKGDVGALRGQSGEL